MMDNIELQLLQKEVAKLEVKIEHLEKQYTDIKSDMRMLRKDIDDRFDDFEEKLNKRIDIIINKLEVLEYNKNQILGGWKTLAILGTMLGGLYAISKELVAFFKP